MLKDKIRKDLIKCMKQLKLDYNDNFIVEVPNNPEHGDYSSNIALVSAKMNKLKPRQLAEEITPLMQKKRDYRKVEIAGPGFINLVFTNAYYHKQLRKVIEQADKFGTSNYGEGKKVLLEFVSANPTGPLNVVSARAAAYGDSLYRIMKHIGFDPFREFYINDAGNQVEILAESIELRYRELMGDNIGEFPPEAYHGEYIKDIAAQLYVIEGTKLFYISEKDRLKRMKDFAIKKLHEMQVESLEKFDVHFDNWMSEKSLRKEGSIEEALSYLAEAKCTYEKDDAIWFCATQFGDEKDRVLLRADGTPTYFVPDLAYHLTKYERGFDIIIDVLGPDHHGYVPRLLAAFKALNLDINKFEVVYLQHITLFERGEQVKMSKRAGKIITMDDIIKEVGKDAARYFFIDRKPSAHLNFDIELAKRKSQDNPVYYCQYAHARICSILRKAKKAKLSLNKFDTKKLKLLKNPDDLTVIKKMLQFEEILVLCSENREPHHLASYVNELASVFHKYYTRHKIIDPDNVNLSLSRLYLISAVKNVIAIALNLISVSAPERM